MAEPTSALTIRDLVKIVAEFLGIGYYGVNGDETAMCPVNDHDLDVCTRIVNNAIRMFIASVPPSPSTGWNWQKRIMTVGLKVMTGSTATGGTAVTLVDSGLATTYANDYYKDCILEITNGTGEGEYALITAYTGATGTFTFSALSGGSTPDTTSEFKVGHRYKLADDFGGTSTGSITYVRDTNHTRSLGWSNETEIRQRSQISVSTSYPYLAVIRPYEDRQYELLVFPDPSDADLVQFPYRKYFDKLQIASGEATGGTATTLIDTSRSEINDYFNGWLLTIISGTGKTETATITDYAAATDTFTFTALSGGSTPDATTKYVVEPATKTHPAGYQFDNAITSACYARAEMEREDVQAGWAQTFMQIDLPAAHQHDKQLAPRSLGYCGSGMRYIQERTQKDVTYDTP
jgi:hypothetical protein